VYPAALADRYRPRRSLERDAAHVAQPTVVDDGDCDRTLLSVLTLS